MTNFIKKMLLSAALGLVLVSPTLAQDAKCERGSVSEIQAAIEKAGGNLEKLSKEEDAAIVAKKGPPPGLRDDEEFDFFIVHWNDLAQFLIGNSDGCVVLVTPQRPAPEDVVNAFLGRNPV